MSGPRRISVERYPGVYYREGAKGRRYEISFTDSEGRRRWKTIEGGQREAVQALADIKARMGRGERVAPSRVTFAEFADEWMATHTSNLRTGTIDRYEVSLRLHVKPLLGRLKLSEVNEDHVAGLIRDMQQGNGLLPPGKDGKRHPRRKQGPWSIRAALTPLSRVMGHAVRRGMIPANPVTKLERGERPKVTRRDMRILEPEEIGKLIEKAGKRYRPIIATAIFTGLRISELLGLRWSDVDFKTGVIRVRRQLGVEKTADGKRRNVAVEPKTPQAIREVVLMPALGRILREHQLASDYSQRSDYVFASLAGTPMEIRSVARRGLAKALKEAELIGEGRPSFHFHDCRHTFASLLVAQGRDVVFVSRQLGHSNPAITLSVYSHLFDHRRHADETRDGLERSFGSILEQAMETTDGDQRQPASVVAGGKVLALHAVSD